VVSRDTLDMYIAVMPIQSRNVLLRCHCHRLTVIQRCLDSKEYYSVLSLTSFEGDQAVLWQQGIWFSVVTWHNGIWLVVSYCM
jgi:hypothetical protein